MELRHPKGHSEAGPKPRGNTSSLLQEGQKRLLLLIPTFPPHKIPRAAGGAAAKPWGVKGAGNTNLGAFSAAAFPGKLSLGMSDKEKPRREQGTDPKAGDVGAPPTSSSVWPAMEQKLLNLVKIY